MKTNIGRFLLTGRVIINGTPSQPGINGELRLAQSRLIYLEREFELEDGFIRQLDPARMDPLIDITATTSIRSFLFEDQRDYTVGLALSGSVFEPEFILTSHPPLEEEQIINLLTTGTVTALPGFFTEPLELISIYSGAASAWRIREWLNLTYVTISGNLFEFADEEGPRLTLMERVNESIYITHQIHLYQPDLQGMNIMYRLFPHLYISGTGTTHGTGSLSLWLYIRR